MYLKSLEIAGFKSFANKSKLEFNTPIAAIVGPNGSGKSNVAEAFRFVLGEQSMKSMRGKRGEDLIFNGADSGGRANRASVKVNFDNSSRFLDLDMDEVTVERTVFRDGANEYSINGSQVRLKDVLEILSKAHIGSTGHHIISQGEADRILNSNPKERKSIIEDALGLKVYQYKKNESEKKLEKTGENIKEIELLRREIAPHIKYLKKQVEKIEESMQMKIELGNLYNEYLKREDLYLEREKDQLTELYTEPKKQKKLLEESLKEAREVLESNKKEDQKSQRFIELDKKISEIRNKKAEIEREIGRVEGQISSVKNILETEKRKLESNDNKMIKLSSVSSMYGQVTDLLLDIDNESDIDKVKNYTSKIKSIISNFIESQKDHVDSSHLDDFVTQIENKEIEKKAKEESLRELMENENNISAEIQKIQSDIEKEKDSNRDAEKAVFKCMADLQNVEIELSRLDARMERWERDKESFEEEIREGVVLVGQKISEYKEYVIRDEQNERLSADSVVSEDREKQQQRRKKLERLKIRLEDAGGANGDDVIKEYEDVTERDQFLLKELEDLHKTSESLRELIADLDQRIDKEFKEGIGKINKEFGKFFALMFGGGNASLSVVAEQKRKSKKDIEEETEPDDTEAEEGVEITVSLPRKKIKGLMMLSGGERALTSIALIFAMSQVNPPPFIILDETDAALDEANSRKYGDMIADLAQYSQLILITHNRETMSRAGVLYGITMTGSGVSKLLSIAFDEAVKVAK